MPTHRDTPTFLAHTHTPTYVCVVCALDKEGGREMGGGVCVCEREREREREKFIDNQIDD